MGLAILIPFFFIQHLKPQNIDELQFLDNGETDSLIRQYSPKPLPSSYYVILVDIGLSETTLLPAVRQEYQNVLQIAKCNEAIVFVIYNIDIPKRFVKDYLVKRIQIEEKKINQYIIIENNELYEKILNGTILLKNLFIFRHKLCYKKITKFYSITETVLPHERIQILPEEKTLISLDTMLLKANDYIFPFKPGYILLLPDMRPGLISVNLKTGAIENVYFTDSLDAYDLIKQINQQRKNKVDIPINRSVSDFYKKIGRQTIKIYSVYYDPPFLYCALDVEIPIKNNRNVYLMSENNEYYLRPKGGYLLTPILTLLVLDEKLKVKDWIVPAYNFPMDSIFLAGIMGFMVKNNEFYTMVFRENIQNDTLQNVYHVWVSKFLLQQSTYTNESKLFNYNDEESNKEGTYGGTNFFVSFKDKILFTSIWRNHWLQIYPSFKKFPFNPFLSYQPKPDYIKPEHISYQDTIEKLFTNYTVLASNKVLDKYLATIYQFQKSNIILEIRDSNMQIVDVIDLSHLDPLTFRPTFKFSQKSSLCIHDNSIIILSLENEQIYLKRYKLEEIQCK